MKIYTLYYITTSASDVFIGHEVEWNVLDTTNIPGIIGSLLRSLSFICYLS